jgi:hypothetical protein
MMDKKEENGNDKVINFSEGPIWDFKLGYLYIRIEGGEEICDWEMNRYK